MSWIHLKANSIDWLFLLINLLVGYVDKEQQLCHATVFLLFFPKNHLTPQIHAIMVYCKHLYGSCSRHINVQQFYTNRRTTRPPPNTTEAHYASPALHPNVSSPDTPLETHNRPSQKTSCLRDDRREERPKGIMMRPAVAISANHIGTNRRPRATNHPGNRRQYSQPHLLIHEQHTPLPPSHPICQPEPPLKPAQPHLHITTYNFC